MPRSPPRERPSSRDVDADAAARRCRGRCRRARGRPRRESGEVVERAARARVSATRGPSRTGRDPSLPRRDGPRDEGVIDSLGERGVREHVDPRVDGESRSCPRPRRARRRAGRARARRRRRQRASPRSNTGPASALRATLMTDAPNAPARRPRSPRRRGAGMPSSALGVDFAHDVGRRPRPPDRVAAACRQERARVCRCAGIRHVADPPARARPGRPEVDGSGDAVGEGVDRRS